MNGVMIYVVPGIYIFRCDEAKLHGFQYFGFQSHLRVVRTFKRRMTDSDVNCASHYNPQ